MGKRSPIVHIEWRSRDVQRLKQFYRGVFRWKFEDPMPGYSSADMGQKGLAAGFMQIEPGTPVTPGIVSFVGSVDLGGDEAAIRDAGGQVLMSAQPVPGWGRFTIFADPDGNQLGLWQSDEAQKKLEKRVRKEAKAAEQSRKAAEKKAKKKEEKERKKAQRAERAAKKAAQKAGDGPPKAQKPEKKKKKAKRRDDAGAEASGSL